MAMNSAERSRRYRERIAASEGRALRKPGRPRTAKHGDPACYNAGCRHPICKAAHNARVANYRASRSGLGRRSTL